MRICKICGENEDEHHTPEWIVKPYGCVCDVCEWNGPVIPPACDKYVGDGTTNCQVCEHDAACHHVSKKT